MDVIHRCCAGLDVHKSSVQACVRRIDEAGQVSSEVREYGTMTGDILRLGDWLASEGVVQVAMESTGVFWKPIWNLLEDRFELMLCNARDIKQVPGRKTDVKDCQWLAQLLQYGLLRASFVPPKPLRELRDLTRHRVQLIHETTRVANRIEKVLEGANIKLGSVASKVLCKSGRAMIEAMIEGEEDPEKLAELAERRLRGKIPELRRALRGGVAEHHRFMLRMLFRHLAELEEMIADINTRIEGVMESAGLNRSSEQERRPSFPEAIDLLITIPGVDRRTAEAVLAEIGTDMSRFPSAQHLASWAGLCPGNNKSAGKRKSGRTSHGDRWLRRALGQAAWAASRTKDTFLSARFKRLARRRGQKRAVIAIAHSILIAIYHMLKRRQPYAELGAHHFHQMAPKRLRNYYIRQLEAMGLSVTIHTEDQAA